MPGALEATTWPCSTPCLHQHHAHSSLGTCVTPGWGAARCLQAKERKQKEQDNATADLEIHQARAAAAQEQAKSIEYRAKERKQNQPWGVC